MGKACAGEHIANTAPTGAERIPKHHQAGATATCGVTPPLHVNAKAKVRRHGTEFWMEAMVT